MPKTSTSRQVKLIEVAEAVIGEYADVYPELIENHDRIINEITMEEARFEKTLQGGMREF